MPLILKTVDDLFTSDVGPFPIDLTKPKCQQK